MIRQIILKGIDHRLEVIRFFDQTDDNKRLAADFQRAANCLLTGKQDTRRDLVQQYNFGEILIVVLDKPSSVIYDISAGIEIMIINPASTAAVQRSVLISHTVHIAA